MSSIASNTQDFLKSNSTCRVTRLDGYDANEQKPSLYTMKTSMIFMAVSDKKVCIDNGTIRSFYYVAKFSPGHNTLNRCPRLLEKENDVDYDRFKFFPEFDTPELRKLFLNESQFQIQSGIFPKSAIRHVNKVVLDITELSNKSEIKEAIEICDNNIRSIDQVENQILELVDNFNREMEKFMKQKEELLEKKKVLIADFSSVDHVREIKTVLEEKLRQKKSLASKMNFSKEPNVPSVMPLDNAESREKSKIDLISIANSGQVSEFILKPNIVDTVEKGNLTSYPFLVAVPQDKLEEVLKIIRST